MNRRIAAGQRRLVYISETTASGCPSYPRGCAGSCYYQRRRISDDRAIRVGLAPLENIDSLKSSVIGETCNAFRATNIALFEVCRGLLRRPRTVRFRADRVRIRTDVRSNGPGRADGPAGADTVWLGDAGTRSRASIERRRGGQAGAREQSRNPRRATESAGPGPRRRADTPVLRAGCLWRLDEEQQQQSSAEL